MKLYHGTNVDFKEIDFRFCQPYKDFGKGFYLTDILRQAKQMAIRKSKVEGIPVVQEYEFDSSALNSSELRICVFPETSAEWASFILNNRMKKKRFSHDYDIVVGPIADDGVVVQLNLYEEGLITMEQLVAALKFRKLTSQYCFCTEKSLTYLRRIQ